MKTSQTKIHNVTFFALLFGALLLLFFIFKPFLSIIFFAVLLAIVFYPLYLRFHRYIKSDSLTALLTVLLIVIVLLGMFWIFGQLLYGELKDFYSSLTSGNFVFTDKVLVAQLPASFQQPALNVMSNLDQYVSAFTSNAFNTVSSVLSNLASFFLNFFLTLFALYYLLKDGPKLKDLLTHVTPLSHVQGNILIEKVISSVNGVVKGTFLIALIQSITALIGFIIFGVPNPLLWSGIAFLAAFIPNIGTSVVMAPIVLYLFVTAPLTAAVGMTIWAVLAVGLIDNLVGPKLVGRQAQLHPLIVLFSVLGGLQLFGIFGFLFGPIVAAVFVVLLKMYATDFKQYLDS